MDKVIADILREVSKYLSIQDIFNLKSVDKRFYSIFDLSFFHQLLQTLLKEKLNKPIGIDIYWYKEKLKYQSGIKFVADWVRAEIDWFECPEYETMDCVEIVDNITGFHCENISIDYLPPMPNLKTLRCINSELIDLPLYPKLEKLDCFLNKISSLPLYPNLIELWCFSNPLTSLPFYPKLERLCCDDCPLDQETLKRYETKIIPADFYQ